VKYYFSLLALPAVAALFLTGLPNESRQSYKPTEFQHTTTSANISANSSALDHAGLNNNPNAIVMVYPVDKAAMQNDGIGVWYDGSKWLIFNQNRSPMSAGLTYRIVFYESEMKFAFTHRASANNTKGSATTLDYPSLAKNDRALVHVTQVWNPGGSGGIYNESNVTAEYQPDIGQWIVRNLSGKQIPDGASFNIDIETSEDAGPPTKASALPEKKEQTGEPDKRIAVDKPVAAAIEKIDKPVSAVEKIDKPVAAVEKIDKPVAKETEKNPAKTETPNAPPALRTVIPGAEIALPALVDLNLGFENAFLNWTPTGTAFGNQPVTGNTVMSDRVLTQMQYDRGGIGGDYWKGMIYPIGIRGDKWIGSYENGNGDAPVGTLTSRPMPATARYLTFLLGGGRDITRLYVELQIKKSDYEAVWGAGTHGFFGDTDDGFTRVDRITPSINSEELYRYKFDLDAAFNHQKFDNRVIRISIVDNKTTSFGHINVDDFVFTETLKDLLALSSYGLYADPDKPVFGFADTHAHWVAHVGLRGLMHGSPGGNWRTSDIRHDVPNCDGYNHTLPTITPGMLIAQTEKAAFRRIPERLADPGNAACIAGVVATGIAFWPSGVATVAGAGIGAGFGALGSAASEAKGSTGALDGLITGTVWGLSSNVAFQGCGLFFAKDVFAKHYNNDVPSARSDVSNYVDFPRWNSFFHQMMHVSQVRRSYDGGQRLMVVPVGTAKSWEFATFADRYAFVAAKTHVEEAVAELKRIVGANADWMGIAYSPRQARQIMLSGKMAVVIALEQAEVGSYFENVDDELNWLEHLGIRHVFPIHNIDNTLGGAAVFNSALNSYNDLVNRRSPNSPIVALVVREGNSSDETRTTMKLDRTFMRQDFRFLPIAGFGNLPFFYSNDVPLDSGDYDRFTSHKNRHGLLPRGELYITGLMRKGMIIDVDHMSDLSQNRAMQMLRAANYPMISGHTNFRDLRREANGTGGDKEPRLKTEFTIFNSRADEINNAGGMFGLMTQQNNVDTAPGSPIPDSAAGGTPSFAQAYWYALQKTGGIKGIAFGTDFNGFAPQTAPRFGVDAAYFLEGDDVLNRKIGPRDEDTPRRRQAFSQRNGVRYDVPVKTYHYHRFLKPPFLTSEEREIWEAIAIAKSGVRPRDAWQPGGGLSVERTGLQQDKIRNLAEGFQARAEGDFLAFLDCPEYISRIGNDCMAERKAAFMAVHGESILPSRVKDTRTMQLFAVIDPIYRLWMQFENGPNEPLRRNFADRAGRDFDFNLDGLAHYGLLPDMIQDMKNIGFTPTQLQPLFKAPEEYLQMWERAERASAAIH
jgi:microsomal dipeptidase-like Zn-dependent dipeptidase